MIEINLLPEELKAKEPRFKKIDVSAISLQNIPVINIAMGAAAILVIVHVILFVIGAYGKVTYGALSKKYNEILPLKKEADTLKSQVGVINKKVSAIDELMVKRFFWAKELNALSDSMTPGVWLTGLSYDEKEEERPAPERQYNKKKEAVRPKVEKVTLRYLVLSGYASSMGEQGAALIGKFIKSLKDNPVLASYFSEIELGSIKASRLQDQEVMSFRITCLFSGTE